MRSLLVIAGIGLSACNQQRQETHADNRLPTASEVFELRSKCADLGQKILEQNLIGSALTQEQVSRYNPQANRCYVRLSVHTADLSTPVEKFIQEDYLFDGQTREMLASASRRNGNEIGGLYAGLEKLARDPTMLPKYQEVLDIIDKFMAEERKP